MRGIARDKADAPRGAIFRDVRQALVEEGIVAQVGVREVADAGEVRDQRQAKSVGYLYGFIQCVVVGTALRALHPVDDALALRVGRTTMPHGDARVV